MTEYDLSKIVVVAVDDNHNMLTILETMLEAMGITKVHKFRGGKAALEELNRLKPDVIITDWKMAPMSGIELFHKIRNGKGGQKSDVPVLMLTGFADADKVLEAREAGVDGFIGKPVATDTLYKHIINVVKPTPIA